MPSKRPISLFRSVRFRIAALNTLAVALAATAALFGLRQAVHWTLLHEVDRVLLEDAAEVGLVIRELGPQGVKAIGEQLGRKAAGHRQHRWFVRLYDVDGVPLWNSPVADEATVPEQPPDLHPRTIGETRTLQSPAPPNAAEVASVQVGSSLVLLNEDLMRIDRLVAVAVVMMLLVAPLCGYWLAGIATRDLEVMTAKASNLRPTQLEERLPYRGVDDEFDRLADTINRLLDRVAEFLEERRSFLADAAHELRTPIAAIRSTVEVALASDRSKERYRELLEQVLDESESLEVLVNQVLMLSEAAVAEGPSPREQIELGEVASRSVEMFRGVAETRNIRLDTAITPGVAVLGIRRHLAQVVNNLLDNAIKYTPEGGTVNLSVANVPQGAQMTVSDSGVGISVEDLPRVFERFFRADRARQRGDARGTGLGLSICESIIESHGGQISCQSQLGVGTLFTVLLPPPDPTGIDGATG